MEKSFQMEGKIVLITGSMSGIGLETAKLFLNESIKGLILLDAVENDSILEELKNANKGAEILYIKCDVSNAQDLLDAYKYAWNSFGYIHLAIHSAGIIDENDSRKIISINVIGVIEASVWLWNKMRKDGGGEGGTIINISSFGGIIDMPAAPIYAATKHAIRCFSQSLGNSLHYEKTNVRVLTVCPTLTRTAMTMNTILGLDGKINDDFRTLMDAITSQKPESVAKVILETYKDAESGTAWISYRDLPAVQYVREDEQELTERYLL